MNEREIPCMWTVSVLPDLLLQASSTHSSIVTASIPISELLKNHNHNHNHDHDHNHADSDHSDLIDFNEGGRGARVALADLVARGIAEQHTTTTTTTTTRIAELDGRTFHLEPLDKAVTKSRRRTSNATIKYPPYVLERSDVWCSETELQVWVRMIMMEVPTLAKGDEAKTEEPLLLESAAKILLTQFVKNVFSVKKLLEQVACVALQQRIRSQLGDMKVVAFVANDSILPRKSGTSDAPMASPPALPFKAPPNSAMEQELVIEMNSLAKHLPTHLLGSQDPTTQVRLSGLVVPAGITLICGGGYHGKSTLLQTIAVGVYDKIPGDGREYCVTVPDAVTVRAEDGRYVNNCNISAFISNLPTPPGVTKTVDTTHFSTRDSSGSTSQAANVAEAIEMGTTAMLIDEDVSAANFMARDGRMRSLVMDESITPLLYRVNGLYHACGISSVVVVGGVGDWLDVPHQVILLDKYVASDATKKAQSISYQFSYGHVQYAGRGVVHRLEWETSGTPIPRRPVDSFSKRYACDVVLSILDGGHALSLHQDEDAMMDPEHNTGMELDTAVVEDDDDEGCIEASRLEQLLGRKQLFGCGLCALWILQAAPKHPSLGLPDLLKRLDDVMDRGGLLQVLRDINHHSTHKGAIVLSESKTMRHLVEEVGFAHRPRKYEVGQALTRMYGIQLEAIPVEEDDSEVAAKREAEEKRQALLKIWENRRTNTNKK